MRDKSYSKVERPHCSMIFYGFNRSRDDSYGNTISQRGQRGQGADRGQSPEYLKQTNQLVSKIIFQSSTFEAIMNKIGQMMKETCWTG